MSANFAMNCENASVYTIIRASWSGPGRLSKISLRRCTRRDEQTLLFTGPKAGTGTTTDLLT